MVSFECSAKAVFISSARSLFHVGGHATPGEPAHIGKPVLQPRANHVQVLQGRRPVDRRCRGPVRLHCRPAGSENAPRLRPPKSIDARGITAMNRGNRFCSHEQSLSCTSPRGRLICTLSPMRVRSVMQPARAAKPGQAPRPFPDRPAAERRCRGSRYSRASFRGRYCTAPAVPGGRGVHHRRRVPHGRPAFPCVRNDAVLSGLMSFVLSVMDLRWLLIPICSVSKLRGQVPFDAN